MTFLQLIRSSLFAAVLGGVASTAFGAAAVAVGDGNYTYTVTDATSIDEAKAEALAECAKRAANCSILGTRFSPGAIALVKGDDGMYVDYHEVPEKARDQALAGCRKSYKHCAFSALYWESGGGWGAWAFAKDQQGNMTASQFSYDYDSADAAKADALARCTQSQGDKPNKCEVWTRFGDWAYVRIGSASYATVHVDATLAGAMADGMAACKAKSKPGDSCKVLSKAFNQGGRKAPASFDRLASQTEVARKAKAPARQVTTRAVQALSCTNRCVNGSCVRTFADGRTEKWQAPRVFDPFTNDWKWDTNSCGG